MHKKFQPLKFLSKGFLSNTPAVGAHSSLGELKALKRKLSKCKVRGVEAPYPARQQPRAVSQILPGRALGGYFGLRASGIRLVLSRLYP